MTPFTAAPADQRGKRVYITNPLKTLKIRCDIRNDGLALFDLFNCVFIILGINAVALHKLRKHSPLSPNPKGTGKRFLLMSTQTG